MGSAVQQEALLLALSPRIHSFYWTLTPMCHHCMVSDCIRPVNGWLQVRAGHEPGEARYTIIEIGCPASNLDSQP